MGMKYCDILSMPRALRRRIQAKIVRLHRPEIRVSYLLGVGGGFVRGSEVEAELGPAFIVEVDFALGFEVDDLTPVLVLMSLVERFLGGGFVGVFCSAGSSLSAPDEAPDAADSSELSFTRFTGSVSRTFPLCFLLPLYRSSATATSSRDRFELESVTEFLLSGMSPSPGRSANWSADVLSPVPQSAPLPYKAL